MRKKLALMLVLVLALGWAGTADASLTLEDSGGPITLNIGSSVDSVVAGASLLQRIVSEIGFDIRLQVISGSVTLDFSSVTFPTAFFFGGIVVGGSTSTNLRLSGSGFSPVTPTTPVWTGVIANGLGTIEVTDLLSGSPVLLGQFDVVPEPMTVGLLALGGLGLLRRRRVVS